MRKKHHIVLLNQYLQNSFLQVKVPCAPAIEWTVVIFFISLTLCFTLVLGDLKDYISKGGKRSILRRDKQCDMLNEGREKVSNRHANGAAQLVNMRGKFVSELPNGGNKRRKYELQNSFWPYNKQTTECLSVAKSFLVLGSSKNFSCRFSQRGY